MRDIDRKKRRIIGGNRPGRVVLMCGQYFLAWFILNLTCIFEYHSDTIWKLSTEINRPCYKNLV
jgi:hypothetical protein